MLPTYSASLKKEYRKRVWQKVTKNPTLVPIFKFNEYSSSSPKTVVRPVVQFLLLLCTQVRGLLPGQQLVQMPDGKLQIFTNNIAAKVTTSPQQVRVKY